MLLLGSCETTSYFAEWNIPLVQHCPGSRILCTVNRFTSEALYQFAFDRLNVNKFLVYKMSQLEIYKEFCSRMRICNHKINIWFTEHSLSCQFPIYFYLINLPCQFIVVTGSCNLWLPVLRLYSTSAGGGVNWPLTSSVLILKWVLNVVFVSRFLMKSWEDMKLC